MTTEAAERQGQDIEGMLPHPSHEGDLVAGLREIDVNYFVDVMSYISERAEEIEIGYGEDEIEGQDQDRAPFTEFVFKLGKGQTTPTPKYLAMLGRRLALHDTDSTQDSNTSVVCAIVTEGGQGIVVSAPVSIGRVLEIFRTNPVKTDAKLADALSKAQNQRAEEVHETFGRAVLGKLAKAILAGEADYPKED